MDKKEKFEKFENGNEVEMFELNWETISKGKAEQQVKNIKASHEVRGDMVEGD